MDEVTPIGTPRKRRHPRSPNSTMRQQERLEQEQQAYEMRAGGKLPSEIAKDLDLPNQTALNKLMVERFDKDANYLTSLDRNSLLGLSFMRLEKLLAAVWPSAMMGDPKSVHEAGDIVMKEARLTGLEQVDPVVNKNLVLVMGEKEEDYIAALKATNSD